MLEVGDIVMLEQDILLCWSGRFCYAEFGDFVMLEQEILYYAGVGDYVEVGDLVMLEW